MAEVEMQVRLCPNFVSDHFHGATEGVDSHGMIIAEQCLPSLRFEIRFELRKAMAILSSSIARPGQQMGDKRQGLH